MNYVRDTYIITLLFQMFRAHCLCCIYYYVDVPNFSRPLLMPPPPSPFSSNTYFNKPSKPANIHQINTYNRLTKQKTLFDRQLMLRQIINCILFLFVFLNKSNNLN